MEERNFWLVPVSASQWRAFDQQGCSNLTIPGFGEEAATGIATGDYLLCCLMGIARFVGVLTVTGAAGAESQLDGEKSATSVRLAVKPLIQLTPDTGLPALELKERLSCFRDQRHSFEWMRFFLTMPQRWKPEDGACVVSALLKARQRPKRKPLDPAKLDDRPKAHPTSAGPVTTSKKDDTPPSLDKKAAPANQPRHRNHLLTQALFVRLGGRLGYRSLIPTDDRRRAAGGRMLAAFPGVVGLRELPFQRATLNALSHMDVMWFQETRPETGFVIERNDFGYRRLLNIADLVVLQPEWQTIFYLVARDMRRMGLIKKINHAVFNALPTPLVHICRFISFEALYRELETLKKQLRFFDPAFLMGISESCEPSANTAEEQNK